MKDDYDGSTPMTKNNHELFAQAVGFHGKTWPEAFLATGGEHKDPTEGARTLSKAKGMKQRIEFLRQCRHDSDMRKNLWTRHQILSKVQANAEEAAFEKNYSASNSALKMLGGEVHGMFQEKVDRENPARALADRSVGSIISEIQKLSAELGVTFDARAFLEASFRERPEEIASGDAGDAESLEGIEDQPLPAEPEAEGVPRAGGEVLGESDSGRQPARENLLRGSGDDLPHDGSVP